MSPLEPPRADRRSERSRTLLLNALHELIAERGYERLTIQHVIDRAGVGRTTFYAHFQGKEELLSCSIAGLRGWLSAESCSSQGQRLGFSLPFLRHLGANLAIYRNTVGRPSEVTVGRHIRAMLLELARQDPAVRRAGVAPDLAAEYTVATLWAVITWWIESNAELSPEEAHGVFERLVLAGLGASRVP